MVSKKFVIHNSVGFDVDTADTLAKTAENCSSTVEIYHKNSIINAKSLLNILSASMKKEDEALLSCTGPEEEKDLERMMEVISSL